MAQLGDSTPQPTQPALTRQLATVGFLRWRVFVNSLRRKDGVGSIIAYLIMIPLLAAILLGPIVAAFAASYYLVQAGTPGRLSWVLWAAFALTQIFNLNLGTPGTTVDPTQLLRFPLSVGRYVVVRLFFGLVTPGNLMIALTSLAIAIGTTLAQPALAWIAFPALAVFALTNLLFTRMIFAWVDRWLSTRRAREVFTALLFILSLGIQWANVTSNPGLNHRHGRSLDLQQIERAQQTAARFQPLLDALPPGLTARAIQHVHDSAPLAGLWCVGITAAFGALFLAVFALRIRVEYGGESLSDTANAVKRQEPVNKIPPGSTAPSVASQPHLQAFVPSTSLRSAHLAAIVDKEFLTLRRNVGLLYGLIAPAVMVFLFAGRLSLRGNSPWILPAAAAYALLGVVPLTFNSFGLEGTGAQLYFYAPVPLRDVFLAKNLITLLIAAFELIVVCVIVSYVTTVPSGASLLFVLLWSLGALLCTTTVGNFMSIRSPRKINPGRTANKQAAPLSALLAMGILLACAAIGAGGMLLDALLSLHWAPLATAALIALTGLLLYWLTMPAMERFALDHRDSLFEELGKKA